jgi:hypothetical protein
MQQVTPEYVAEVCRANCFPPGYRYTVVIVSIIKRSLAADIPAEYRLKFLNQLDQMASGWDGWLTADMIATIEPMCDRGHEMYTEAAKLDRGKPGQPAMFDALNKFFSAFCVLNPTLITALELEPRRLGYFRPIDQEAMTS